MLPPVLEPVVLVVEPVLPEVPVELVVLDDPVVPVELVVLPEVLDDPVVPVELVVLPDVLVEPVEPVELVVELEEVVPLSSLFLSFLQLVASNKDRDSAPAMKATFVVCDVFMVPFFVILNSSFKPHSILLFVQIA